jgi:hypothetical protein
MQKYVKDSYYIGQTKFFIDDKLAEEALERIIAYPLIHAGEKRVLGEFILAEYDERRRNGGRLLLSCGYERPSILDAHGIQTRTDRIVVANQHPKLNEIFKGTVWQDGFWREGLRKLMFAKASNPGRYSSLGGKLSRGTSVSVDDVIRIYNIHVESLGEM